ncbi:MULTISPECIES: hypothetical protein [Priestia]|uniref:hypothetical protein n=1 Tax=Priestia TaxID=2800373 RepID=UPI001C8E89C8|nr:MULTISPECIES: hypothetical protein [Priestia]MBX9996893.1 hypothetical protein [Priestia aryabhattai]MED4061132.1 hypothetical protein [Priestia megaterium]
MLAINKKYLVIGLCVAIFMFSIFLFLNENKKELASGKEAPKLKFAHNFISYVVDDDEAVSFNIFAAENVKTHTSNLENSVDYIDLNNPNIEVVNFKVNTGFNQDNYELVNFVIDVTSTTTNVEQAKEMIIHFKDGSKKSYNFGQINLQQKKNASQHLDVSGRYTIGYPSLELNAGVKNKTNSTILPIEVYDLTKTISHRFNNNLQLQPQKQSTIEVNDFYLKNKEEYDFITMTPIVSYKINNNQYTYHMPGVIYGALDSDQEKLNKIIKDN